MFSYPAGILQTSGAKRAENQFNGAVESSSGKIHVETAASAVTRGAAERQGRAETSNLTAPSAQTTRTARTRAARPPTHTSCARDETENKGSAKSGYESPA